jgi:hypothetical protein
MLLTHLQNAACTLRRSPAAAPRSPFGNKGLPASTSCVFAATCRLLNSPPCSSTHRPGGTGQTRSRWQRCCVLQGCRRACCLGRRLILRPSVVCRSVASVPKGWFCVCFVLCRGCSEVGAHGHCRRLRWTAPASSHSASRSYTLLTAGAAVELALAAAVFLGQISSCHCRLKTTGH